MKAFTIDNSNEVKGGAIATYRDNQSTGGRELYDNWYLFKDNNKSADNPITTTVETSHWDNV